MLYEGLVTKYMWRVKKDFHTLQQVKRVSAKTSHQNIQITSIMLKN